MTSIIVPSIIAAAYLEARCDSNNVTAAPAIQYCDDVYQELIDEKKLVNEDFIKRTYKLSSLPMRNKYSLPSDFEKMQQISIKYSVPTYDARVTATAYVIGDKVTRNWKAYVCTSDHTAGASFENTKTFTTSAIMVANETVTIDWVVLTAKAAGAAVNSGDFAIWLDQASSTANLFAVINSTSQWSAATFIALSTYNKNLLADAEIVATNPTAATVVITSNDTITTSETSGVWAWGTETGWNWLQIYEWYIPCTPRMVDFDFMQDFNNISESNPVYFYKNNDLFIYPRPKVAVTQWIIMEYIPSQEALTITTDDWAIQIESKLHDAWVYGVAKKFMDYMGKDSTKQDLDFQKWLIKCNNWWKNRHYAPVTEELPSSLYRYMR